jgi:hypothetical protein
MLKSKTLALLALAGFGLFANSAKAVDATYSVGDLFIGFHKTGGAQNYLINIGQASQYRDAVSGFSLMSAGPLLDGSVIATELVSIFGSNWFTSGTFTWGVLGATSSGDANGTIYVSRPETVFGTAGTPYLRTASATALATQTQVNNIGNWYDTSGTTSAAGAGQIQTAADEFSWASVAANNSAPIGQGQYLGFNDTFALGAANTQLDLFRMLPGSSGSPGTFEGTFTIEATNSSVNILFNTLPVPEPSSAALLGLGALAAFARRRRSS